MEPPSRFSLYSIIACANIPMFAMGTCLVWTSPMMPKLKGPTDDSPLDFKINRQQQGWIFSLISIGAGVSAYFGGRLSNRCGRKAVLIIASTAYALAYLLLFLASGIAVIYVARLLHGVGSGLSMTVVTMYGLELAPKESRGSVGTIMMLFMTFGQLYALVLGPYTEYWVFQLLCLAIPLISFVGYMYIPESPYYLIQQDRFEDAVLSLNKVRGQGIASATAEIIVVIELVDRARKIGEEVAVDLIRHGGNRKALIIALGLMAFQILCGAIIISVNSQSIFAEAQSNLDPPVCAIIIGVVQVIAGLTLQFYVNRWKRRTLLRISAVVMALTQFAVGILFYIDEVGDASQIRWLPLAALIIFQIAYRSGFGPLPMTIAGELCAANIKTFVVSGTTITCFGLGFFVTLLYPMVDALGRYYIFFFFTISNVLAFFFVQFYVIETKGLTLKEILEQLDK